MHDFDFCENSYPYDRLLYLSYLISLVGVKGVSRSYWVPADHIDSVGPAADYVLSGRIMLVVVRILSSNSFYMTHIFIPITDCLVINCPQISLTRWKQSCVTSIFFRF